jgi:hypothetical protein
VIVVPEGLCPICGRDRLERRQRAYANCNAPLNPGIHAYDGSSLSSGEFLDPRRPSLASFATPFIPPFGSLTKSAEQAAVLKKNGCSDERRKSVRLGAVAKKTEESLASNHAFAPVGANTRKFVETLQDQIRVLIEITLCSACKRSALTPERKIARRTVLSMGVRFAATLFFTFTGLG